MIRAVKIFRQWDRIKDPIQCPIWVWLEPKAKILSLVPTKQETIEDQRLIATLFVDEPGKTKEQVERELYVVSTRATVSKEDSHGWAFLATIPAPDHRVGHLHFYTRII